MKKYTFALCLGALAGCSNGGGYDTRAVQLPADGALAETVNGTLVPQSLLEAVARARGLHLDKQEQREQALKLTTDYVLMAQAVQRENFLADQQFRADVELARLKAIAEGGVAAYEKQTPISDEVLKAQYDAEVARAGKVEYDFTQLLFADEAPALEAQGAVLAGKPFGEVYDAWRGKAKVAKRFSRVRSDQLPEALATAFAAMKTGEHTKVPVKTEFGWMVAQLDASNAFNPPPFDLVKDKIREGLQAKAAQQRVEKLREQAKVDYPVGSVTPVVQDKKG